MHAVQIAELKNKLSAYLNRVRAGEELVVRDRKVAVAKIVPLCSEDLDLEEQALVVEGVMTPPKERFDPERFWGIGRGLRRRPGTAAAIDRAMDATREGRMSAFWDASALVHVCLPGQESGRAKELLRTAPTVTWWATTIEVRGALNRPHREGLISKAALKASRERLSGLLRASRCIEPVEIVKELALAQLDRFPLKAGDSLQLAAALVWCRQRPHRRKFVRNDRQLRSAADELSFEIASV